MTKQDKTQRERFIDFARERGADNPDPIENAIDQLVHASDCGIHNAPAMKPGRCDCGAIKAER
jgi:hypothetical protein